MTAMNRMLKVAVIGKASSLTVFLYYQTSCELSF